MEFIKDYGCAITYHHDKANVVADTLRRKSSNRKVEGKVTLLKDLKGFKLILDTRSIRNLIARCQVRPTLEGEIIKT